MEIIRIDLDETKVIEKKTAGLTDDQIRRQKVEAIESQIRSAELAIEGLQKHIDSERERIAGLRQVLQRKRELGG